jgi:pyrroloquinoline-quinone synthase
MEKDNFSARLDREAFLAELHSVGRKRYHDKHPFHQLMNNGGLTNIQLQRWVANRFYYQSRIPVKDAAILSNCPLPEVRRVWLPRIITQDGMNDGQGGIAAWLRLAEAVGLTREETLDERHVLPTLRFSVDAYVQFARCKPWPIAVASSLTELFAPELMRARLVAFQKHYTWIPAWGLDYFQSRVTQAHHDSEHALELTLAYCTTLELQRQAIRALEFKCDVLWAMLDAMMAGFHDASITIQAGNDLDRAKRLPC